MQEYINYFKEYILSYGPKIATALVIIVVGLIAIEYFNKIISALFKKSRYSATLEPFVVGVVSILLKIVLGINVLHTLGFQTTSFLALLGSAGLAIGLSLSNSIKNFAGGLILLHSRPFKVGDLIEAQGQRGKVKEIQIFNTVLTTPDNKTVFLSNGPLSDGSIVNYYRQPVRRVETLFNVDYQNDISKVKEAISRAIASDERILNDPAPPLVAVFELGDTHVKIRVRAWTKSEDYWKVFYTLQENVKNTFDQEKITCHICPQLILKKN